MTGRWSDVISGWWSSVLLLGHFKSGCTFRLEEYVFIVSQNNVDLYSRLYIRLRSAEASWVYIPTRYCAHIILRGWNILTLRGVIT